MAITLIKKPAETPPAQKKVIVLGKGKSPAQISQEIYAATDAVLAKKKLIFGVKKNPASTDTAKPVAAPVEEMTQRQKDALDAVGLGEADPTPPISQPKKLGKKAAQYLHDGTPVRITNDLFSWLKQYQTGDTGVIVKSWPPTGGALTDEDPERYRLYEMKMDTPRIQDIVRVRCWEIEEIKP